MASVTTFQTTRYDTYSPSETNEVGYTRLTDGASSEVAPEKEISCWNKCTNWLNAHKKEIFIALLVVGIALLTLGIGLLTGAALSGSFYTFSYTWWQGFTATLSTAGEVAIAGTSIAFAGAIATSAAGAALCQLPQNPEANND